MTDYYSNYDQNVIIQRRRKRGRFLIPVIIIIAVILIILPIYGTTLRYKVGASIRLLCDYFGNIFQHVGWFSLGIVVFQALITHMHYVSIKLMAIGLLCLYAGAFLTGGFVSILGLTLFEPSSSPGYHFLT